MRRPRLLISLLILASVLADAVLFGMSLREGRLGWSFTSLRVLGFCQVNLVSLWLCLGRTPWQLRVMAALATIVVWSLLISYRFLAPLGEYAASHVMQLMVVFAPGLIARQLGLCVWNVADRDEPPSLPGERQPLQFSILQLLGWTTAAAIVLATLKAVEAVAPASYQYLLNKQCVVALIAYAAMAWTDVWAVLGQGRPVLRAIVMLVTLAAAIGGLCIATGSFISPLLLKGLTQITLLMLASLSVVHAAGYRVGFRRAAAVSDAAAPSDAPQRAVQP